VQEREDVHRGGGAVALIVLAASFLAIVEISSPPAKCEVPLTSFELRGGPGDLAWGGPAGLACSRFPAPPGKQRIAGAFASYSNPYMLENLSVSDLLAEVRARGRSASADWRHLGHPLYREDRLMLALGTGLPLAGLECAVGAAVKRSTVRGFPAAASKSFSLGVSCARAKSFGLTIAGTPFNDEPGARREVAAALSVRAAAFSILLEQNLAGAEMGGTRLIILAELGPKAALVSGYQSPTDELLAGVIIRVRSVLLGLSWSYNPALGKTITAGLGRWWAW